MRRAYYLKGKEDYYRRPHRYAVPLTFEGVVTMSTFLAIVIPIGSGYPDQGLPVPPPGIWPGPGVPTHPIAPGGPPPGIWPSPGHPSHPIAPGGPPPQVWPGPGQPTHPIFLPPTQPPPPAEVWPPQPPDKPQPKEGYYLAYVPGLGQWVYIPVDTTKPVPVPEPKK
jgi:hypothetical protein